MRRLGCEAAEARLLSSSRPQCTCTDHGTDVPWKPSSAHFRQSDAEHSDRSAGDRLRHRQKVRESIRENIADIIAEESIIGKDRDRIIKVPLRGIKEYRFVYGENAPGRRPGRRRRAARPGRR